MAVYEAKNDRAFADYDLQEGNGVLTGFRRLSRAYALWSAERRNFNDAVYELSALSDRDLADIGIARCDIQRVAREAAKMKRAEA